MSSCVHFSLMLNKQLKRSGVSSGRSSTLSKQMVSGLVLRSSRAIPLSWSSLVLMPSGTLCCHTS
uniref:Uncharacterized protein n=1 Tax=Anguilla anguilla TaxID=7936 RepID=A0A0E9W6W2_ANGAN